MSAANALARVYPAALALLLAAWAALLPSAAGRLRRRLAAARPGTGYALAALMIAALALRLSSGPVHQVYYDEFEHLDIARHLADSGTFAETVVGGLPGWDVLARPPWPAGHHVALAAAFRLFGAGTGTAFVWSSLLSTLSALFVFWAALELFADERGALTAAFFWAVCPVVLRYAAACDLTSSSLFWSAAALAALHAREAEPSPALDAFTAVTMAYAVQIRFESPLLLAYAAAVCSRRVLLAPAALGLAFPAALIWANHAAALPGFVAVAPWTYLARQAPSNLLFLAGPAALGILLLPALLFSAARPSSRRLAVLAAAYFAVYTSYVIGDFARGSSDRYALSVLLPLLLAAAPGLAAMSVPACLLAAGLAWSGPAAPEPEHEAARRFLAGSARLIPKQAYVAAFNPPFVREVAKRPAAGAFLMLEDLPAFERERARVGSAPELALYKDWAWRSRPEAAARLEKTLSANYNAVVLADNGLDSLVLLSPKPRGR